MWKLLKLFSKMDTKTITFVGKLKKIEENWFQLITGINIIDLYVPDNGIIFAGRYFDISDNADRYESSSEGKQTKSK